MKSSEKQHASIVVGQTIIGFLLAWAMIYNIVIKEHGLTAAFFKILDTITEDMVMGSLVTVVVGFGIVIVFTVTKLYTQIISKDSSFRILEKIFYEELGNKRYREFAHRLLNFEQESDPESVYPLHPSSVLISFSFLYLMSWIYLVLFSEALFFVSWSAGADLPIGKDNVDLLPLLALSIPFSARVMAYIRYTYTQDYADFMPGAVFVLLLVAALGYLFRSDDQQFFLIRVWSDAELFRSFLQSGLTLAFIPVFSEAVFWMMTIFFSENDEEYFE